MDEKKKFEMWRRNCGYITEDAKGLFWECWQAAQDAVTRSAGDGEYSGLSWRGHNIRGDRESIEAVKTAIHHAGTVPELKDEIAVLRKRIAGEGREAVALTEDQIAVRAGIPFVGLSVQLVKALRRLSFAAQTSGGTAGRDDELMGAILQAQEALDASKGKGLEESAAPPESRQMVASGDTQKPVATIRVTNNGYSMTLSTYVAYALPEGKHDLYAAPPPSGT